MLLVGHYGCGGIAAFAAACAWAFGQLAATRARHFHQAHRASLHAIADRDAKLRRLCELHVAEQVACRAHHGRAGCVGNAGQTLTVHGCVYGIEDGLLRTLDMICPDRTTSMRCRPAPERDRNSRRWAIAPHPAAGKS